MKIYETKEELCRTLYCWSRIGDFGMFRRISLSEVFTVAARSEK
jgi:hypothetical protein